MIDLMVDLSHTMIQGLAFALLIDCWRCWTGLLTHRQTKDKQGGDIEHLRLIRPSARHKLCSCEDEGIAAELYMRSRQEFWGRMAKDDHFVEGGIGDHDPSSANTYGNAQAIICTIPASINEIPLRIRHSRRSKQDDCATAPTHTHGAG